MEIFEKNGDTFICGVSDFDPVKIFECGQCFRWNLGESGAYTGVALGKAAEIRLDGGDIVISGGIDDFEKYWRAYFDLDRDYTKIRNALCIDEYMREASQFGAGIRILRQDPWEALCSFIISQCNNIPRIKKIIEKLCSDHGDAVSFKGRIFKTFPSAEVIAGLCEKDLEPLHCGYRAPYILAAARAVVSGETDLRALRSMDVKEAEREIKKLAGVGDKVANCFILFGLHRLDAFPIDVWMKRAIAKNYCGDFDAGVFGEYAGLAQQYMFYHARSKKCRIVKHIGQSSR